MNNHRIYETIKNKNLHKNEEEWITAALFMMISKTILQSCAMLGHGAGETLMKMNAGHEYPSLKRKNGEFELLKDKHGFVIGEVYGSVNAFVKDAEQFDDVTMLCMEYHGNLKQTVAD